MDVLRTISGIVWLVLLIWLFPSATRHQFNRGGGRDGQWTVVWFFAFIQVGSFARHIVGLTPVPVNGESALFTAGLVFLSLIVGAGLIWRRWELEGFRW